MVAGCLMQVASEAAAQATTSLEYRVKANYLVRFAAFVGWPASAFASSSTPLTLCVAGRDPFGVALDQAAAGQTAHARPIVVRRPQTPSEAASCHLIYAAQGSGAGYRVPMQGRLLVTEAGDTGMIAFHLRDGRVRFDVDLVAARRSNLTLSSRLLDLAVSVRGG